MPSQQRRRLADPSSRVTSLEALREPVENGLLLRGFAPLLLVVALLLLMVLMVPSVAPEQVLEQPAPAAGP